MAIIQSLRKIEINAQFYNIDYFRYSHEEITEYFEKQQFDVVGISAVVSTAYTYTKYLSKLIRRVSPDTLIIVGGNLGASAEILLNKCEVDCCVLGDGEFIVQDLMPVLKEKPLNYDRLRETKGIAFLDEQRNFCFTGYGTRPSKEEIGFPDYSILEEDGSLSFFLSKGYNFGDGMDADKAMAIVITAKGCVARCTFCHRFERGFRAIPPDKLVEEHLRHIMTKYNVGYISVGDENFGSDRKAAEDIAISMGKLGLKWRAAGVRTDSVSKKSLQHWKDNGCVEVIYGVESGSPKILKVMEKNLTLEENISALKWTGEVGLDTVLQLVIGMPGENDDTISETIEFLKKVSPYIRKWKGQKPSVSINYAQALPGTPLYEHAREQGLIGISIDAEEQYLINISDVDAYSEDHFVNLTGLPLLKVLMWRDQITASVETHHIQNENVGKASLPLLQVIMYYVKRVGGKLYRALRKIPPPQERDSGYFNFSNQFSFALLLLNPITKNFLNPIIAIKILFHRMNKPKHVIGMVFEFLLWRFKRGVSPAADFPEKSLRKIVSIVASESGADANKQMIPLRKGR
jgi:anaerobic magnesium-protoporphyrin IX monomethyl ester cyclase